MPSPLDDVLAWDDPEQVLRAIEGKPLVGSLWHRITRTHLDREIVGRVEQYTAGGRLVMVHHLCEDATHGGVGRGVLGPGCGYEWVAEVEYVLSAAWEPYVPE